MTITITEIELSLVRLDLIHEFETSSHRKSHLDHIVVRATASDGTVGWGECASPSDPYYCSESTESCWYVLSEHLAPMVLGRPWEHPDDAAGLTTRLSGNHFARAGLDMACWDLYGQAHGETLSTLVGGTAERISAGVSLGIEPTVDALLDQVARHVGDGYRRIKLKCRPGWDLEPVRAVRAAFPGIALQVDANTGYRADSAEHLAALTALDDQGLLMIEQPFAEDDLLGHRRPRRPARHPRLSRRVDHLTRRTGHRTAPGRCRHRQHQGVPARRNRTVRRGARRVPRGRNPGVVRGMHEFGIGRAANLAVASLPGFTLPSDVSGSDKYYRQDIVTPPIRATEGLVPVPDARPGLGVHVDESLIRANRLRHAVLKEG